MNDYSDLCYNTEHYEYVESGFSSFCYEIRYKIEFDECVVSDFCICVKRSQLGETNILDLFVYITLIVGNIPITKLNYKYNLFFAKMLGKKIIECDDVIKIPIIIFDLNTKNKFPIC